MTFDVAPGEVVGLVGESGCGKTTLGLAVLSLLPDSAKITSGTVRLNGEDLVSATPERLRQIRGGQAAMIFQNPMRSLHPARTIGWQLREAYQVHHRGTSRGTADDRAVDVLEDVGIPDARSRLKDYPHQFSGGMQQRVMIAMALINDPKLLIADEPTTALDVTIQAQILELIRDLARDRGMGVLLVTHSLGIVSSLCARVVVLYAGQVVEHGAVADVFVRPQHPYTRGLLRSTPSESVPRLYSIPGSLPGLDMRARDVGCRFRSRCDVAFDACSVAPPLFETEHEHASRCWLADSAASRAS
ncbi:oligopeptide/dipeptide ABC transporter ATP-binding protein [Microbacterium ulmi]|uniref:oligopeptide/dipeptide ABC transporter ATP-binding protein n=1 Tax=Microbacterium ulmi TaxID=179095 RepID=UPI001ABB8A20|nr:oligopeptide/dipeptide ABC transporter ATP-binding protein [Microbacterium ulmi]